MSEDHNQVASERYVQCKNCGPVKEADLQSDAIQHGDEPWTVTIYYCPKCGAEVSREVAY